MPNKATIFIIFSGLFIALIVNKHEFIGQTIKELSKMYGIEFEAMSLFKKSSIEFLP